MPRKIQFIRPRLRETQTKKTSSTASKAALELLTRVRLSSKEDIEDKIGEDSEGEDIEFADSLHERELFRKSLGFDRVASRGYEITSYNIRNYYRLRARLRMLQAKDPEMKKRMTQIVYSLFVIAKDSLKGRSITKDQTNVEVVDQEPVVKYIPVPTYSQAAVTDMEKKNDEEE